MNAKPKTEAPGSAPGHRQVLAGWWLLSLFWLLIALASMLELMLFRSAEAGDAFRSASMQWLPWMVLSPLILWLSATFTLERSTWLRYIWLHLIACVAIVGGLGALAYYQGPQPFSRGIPPPFGGRGGPPRGEPGDREAGRRGPPRGGESDGEPRPFRAPGERRPPQSGEHRSPPVMDQATGEFDPGSMLRPRRGPPPTGLIILGLSTFQLPTFWAVLGGAHALIFYQRAKDRERRGVELEARLTLARLDALRMQLNPHFLFNTLNSIASLVYDQPRAADEMIGSLSDLLRLTLNSSGRQEVTLREELHFLDQYLRIEQTRFGDRLKIEQNIDPAALEATVPILILQPLAENAVKHGIESRIAPGIISLTAQRVGDALHLVVSDNGRGPVTDADGQLREGVGLSNTRGRLRELYGDRASMEFHAREGGGFVVKLRVPWKLVAPAPAAGQPAAKP